MGGSALTKRQRREALWAVRQRLEILAPPTPWLRSGLTATRVAARWSPPWRVVCAVGALWK